METMVNETLQDAAPISAAPIGEIEMPKRRMAFWAALSLSGILTTAKNKKLLRQSIDEGGKENYKGTKIRQFEVFYHDHAHIAATLAGFDYDTFANLPNVNMISEYEA